MGNQSPHTLLGIAVDADEAEIRRAFRVAALATHPDRGGDRDRFEAIHAAYETLRRGFAAAVCSDAPRAHSGGRSSVPRDPYAQMLVDLDAAAAMVVTRPTPGVSADKPRPAPDAWTSLAATASAFRRIFERELERQAA